MQEMRATRLPRLRLITLLSIGIAAVSCGSIFIKLASAPALAVAAYRVLWAAILLAPFAVSGSIRELTALSRKEWGLLLLSGTALALHFALWIVSLSYTSVASSVVLVDTTPFFVGLVSQWFLRKPLERSFWIGVILAFAGCLVIFKGDLSESHSSMKGNALALAGAGAMAIYFLVGASARLKLSLLAYVWPVYGTAALALSLACIASQTPLRGFGASTYLYLFLLGLIPQCIGHTTYNWSLRWLPPALVALISLAEPVGASLLAYIILGETLTLMKLLGGGVILLGIYLATRSAE